MRRRGEVPSEFGIAYFDKKRLGDQISPHPLQVLSKTNYLIRAMRM